MSAPPVWTGAAWGALVFVRRPFSALGLVAVFVALAGGVAALGAGVGALWGGPAAWAAICVAACAAWIVHQAALWRVFTRGGGLAAAPRLGADEARVGASLLALLALLAAPPILLGGAGLAWGAATDLPVLARAGALVGVVASVALLARFSLAAGAAVARRRFSFFHSWSLTVGSFWSIAAANVLALAAGAGVIVGAAAAAGIASAEDAVRFLHPLGDGDARAMATWAATASLAGVITILTAGPTAHALTRLSAPDDARGARAASGQDAPAMSVREAGAAQPSEGR